MNKKDLERLEQEIIIADILLRLTTIEKILIKNNITNNEEFSSIMKDLSEKVAKSLLEKANITQDLDSIVQSYNSDDKKN
jgi:hypothetical protein